MTYEYINDEIYNRIMEEDNTSNVSNKAEKNKELLTRYTIANDKEKKEISREIILLNMPYLKYLTKKYTFHKDDYEDNFISAVIGMYGAIKHFDIEADIKFSTYSFYWVRKEILENYVIMNYPFKVPNRSGNILYQISKYIEEWQYKYHTDAIPTAEEISNELGYSKASVSNYLVVLQPMLYLSMPISKDNTESDDMTLGNLLKDEKINIEEDIVKKIMFERVENIIDNMCQKNKITERNYNILKLRYGYYGKPMTLEEIAKIYNLTRERVRQIEQKTLEKIRNECKKEKINMEGLY